MNMKINAICFVILLFLLVGIAAAADSDNETLKHTTDEQDISLSQDDVQKISTLKSAPDSKMPLEAKLNDSVKMQSENSKLAKSSASITDFKQKVVLKAPSVKMHYGDGSKFTVTLKDKNKKVIKKAKIEITINQKTYTKKTNSKGQVSLDLNLKPGKYTVFTCFPETSKYHYKAVSSTVNVKTTLKTANVVKYYGSNTAFKAKYYGKDGKVLKKTSVKIKLDGTKYTLKTDKNGIVKLALNMNPGLYSIKTTNPQTSESYTNTILVNSILYTSDLTMDEKDGSTFNVRILTSKGQAAANKAVLIKVNGKIFTPKSNAKGMITQTIDLPEGKYSVTTEYGGLKNTNIIKVNRGVKTSQFTHSMTVPNYVNVTVPYAFHYNDYTLETGTNGTVKMPKVEIFKFEIGSNTYTFSTGTGDNFNAVTLDEKSYLIPFDGSNVISSYSRDALKGYGIVITKTADATEIDYQDVTASECEMFGFYADRNSDNSEVFTYVKNDKVTATLTVQTDHYDEAGVKYSLQKLYNRASMNFNYQEILSQTTNPVVFTNTGKPVTYSYFTNYIEGYQSREDILTRFINNGKILSQKTEQISYGLSDKYNARFGFEVLQSYSIINDKIQKNALENLISDSAKYISQTGVSNLYGMHLASLESCWLADNAADEFAKALNINWQRTSTAALLAGINLNDVYLQVLNPDMGMSFTGDASNIAAFKAIHSMTLPYLEDYTLSPVSKRFMYDSSNSLDVMIQAFQNSTYRFAQLGDKMYFFAGDNDTAAMIVDTSSGLAEVVHKSGDELYRGSSIATKSDCCSIRSIPSEMISGIRQAMKIDSPGLFIVDDVMKNTYGFSMYSYAKTKSSYASSLSGTNQIILALVSSLTNLYTLSETYTESMLAKEYWHSVMDAATFKRLSNVYGKEVFAVGKNGGSDFVEVDINSDMTLNRNSAVYLSNGNVNALSSGETYEYFSQDYWAPFEI